METEARYDSSVKKIINIFFLACKRARFFCPYAFANTKGSRYQNREPRSRDVIIVSCEMH